MGKRAEWDPSDYMPKSPAVETDEITAIRKRETSTRFLLLMVRHMMVSFFKYGPVADGFPERIDAIACIKLRLEKYQETGNVEHLVDLANYAQIEFMHPRHPNAHFKPTDQTGSPGRVPIHDLYEGKPNQLKNTDLLEDHENPFE